MTVPNAMAHVIWLTRGHDWGYRFLLDGGTGDPVRVHEEAFTAHEDDREVCVQRNGRIALRFIDPLGRRDFSGRSIVHDFVLPATPDVGVATVADGVEKVWPLVAHLYAEHWAQDAAPEDGEVKRALGIPKRPG